MYIIFLNCHVHGGLRRAKVASSPAKSATEVNKAALHTVQAGGAVPQAVATKWTQTGPTRPYCRLESEDNFHRYWRCPRWEPGSLPSGGTSEAWDSGLGGNGFSDLCW